MPESTFQVLPLQDKRVLVTRTREQAGALSSNLRSVGALPVELPVIRIEPPADWRPLDEALRALIEHSAYDWLIFTSANGVNMALERLRVLNYEPQALSAVRIATIGPATASALKRYGLSASLVPNEYIAESVAEALRGETLVGKRVLLARAAEARQVLVTELEQAGAQVDVVAAYQTLPVAQDDERGREVIALLNQQQLDVITFTSSSTVHHFMRWLGQAAPDNALTLTRSSSRKTRPLIACIGPITATTARSYGLDVSVEASEFTTAGLVEALVEYEEKHT
ncbi:MAG TPA: uroporphyrinogen-III synthase [Ktedonobacteraceae bacterium]|nr:uroporphyrinogen-III synthase [Ktedonobacteraceae bacterium]